MKILDKERHGDGMEYQIELESSSPEAVLDAYLKLASIDGFKSFEIVMDHDCGDCNLASHNWYDVEKMEKEALKYLNDDTSQIEMLTEIDDNYVRVFSIGLFDTEGYILRVWNCLDEGCVEKFIKEAAKLI